MRAARIPTVLLAATLCACGGGADRIPTADPPPTPTPTPPTSGRIADLTAARDIIRYNQDAPSNAPRGICRWELPVRVYVEPPAPRAPVVEALDHWRASSGTEYVLVEGPAEPVLHVLETRNVREPYWGVGGVSGTDAADNRARTGFVQILPGRWERRLVRHEIGHALGFFEHGEGGGLMCEFAACGEAVSPREGAMMATLYTLPFGARVAADGSWQVPPR